MRKTIFILAALIASAIPANAARATFSLEMPRPEPAVEALPDPLPPPAMPQTHIAGMLDLNNAWTGSETHSGTETFSNGVTTNSLKDTGITGLVQCIHADSAGNFTGAGADCSAGTGVPVGPNPWIDITNAAYGGKSRTSFPTTTATTTATSGNVSLAAAQDFVNGDGIVIWKAGAATSQSTPTAPTVTSPAVHGSRTINYKCVGVDALGGLTAASPAGTVTNAPNSMGDQPVQIVSLTQSAGVVSVVTASPLLHSAANLQLSIYNAGGAHTVDGVFPIATWTNSTHFTYNLSGSAGSITIGSFGAWARLTDSFNITAITRSGTTLTVTTNINHGIQVQSGGYTNYSRTIAVVQGIDQSPVGATNDMNGEYIVLSASTNTMTLESALSKTETGTLVGYNPLFQPTLTVYPYVSVACPSLGGGGSATIAYYIYADYENVGTYNLVGKTLPGYPGQSVYTDYGPWQGGAYSTLYLSPTGFEAPAYVPTTAPGAAQKQMYVGKITSGGGSTAITVSPVVPSSVTTQTAMHDEAPALNAALAAAQLTNGGTVYIPPSTGSFEFNSPVQVPLSGNFAYDIKVGSPLILNETLSAGSFTNISYSLGGSQFFATSFDRYAGVPISGLASPQISSIVGPLTLRDLYFSGPSSGSQTSVYASGNGVFGLSIDRCTFGGEGTYPAGSSVPLVLGGITGITAQARISDSLFTGFFNGMGNGFTSGGSTVNIGPNIPTVWIRGNDDQSFMPQVTFSGENVFAGRGVLYDGTYGQFQGGQQLNYYEYQSPLTPTAMYYGTANFDSSTGTVSNGNNDSQPGSIVGNWSPDGVVTMLTLDNVVTSGAQNLVTGSSINGLVIKNVSAAHPVGQNFNFNQDTQTASNIGLPLVSVGVVPALSGTGACATQSTQVGGNWAGSLKCTGSTGASTIVITPGTTAPNGWTCSASDITTANALRQSATAATTCTISGTVNSNDVITFSAISY
jgi:hypothetical protein